MSKYQISTGEFENILYATSKPCNSISEFKQYASSYHTDVIRLSKVDNYTYKSTTICTIYKTINLVCFNRNTKYPKVLFNWFDKDKWDIWKTPTGSRLDILHANELGYIENVDIIYMGG